MSAAAGFMFATIAGPEGHRVATYLTDGRIRCECRRVFADRGQLAAHTKLLTMLVARVAAQ